VLAIGLALGASLGFGVADFLAGLSARRLPLLVVLGLTQLVGLASIAAVVAVRFEGPPGAGSLGWAALAGVFGAAAVAALYRGLAVGLMSVVAPIAATAAVIPVIAGVAIGEAPAPLQNAGIGLALAGVVLASRATAEAGRSGLAAGAGLGLLAALFIGSFLVVFDAASEGDPYWATLVVRIETVAIFAVAALVLRPAAALARQDAVALVAIGVLDLTATALFAVSTTKGLVGVVSVLSSLYPVVTVALARALLGERLSTVQAAGVATAFAGVALIAMG
jgi:drug/metabolite transporter (DMT)-like permease